MKPERSTTGFAPGSPWQAGVCLLLAAGLAAGCSRRPAPSPASPPPPAADVLATVGQEEIKAAQFTRAMARRKLGDDPQAKRILLDEMIRFRALVQEAKQRGYDRDPQLVAEFENLLATRVRETQEETIRAEAEVTPQEIDAFYAAHVADFTVPTTVRAAVIFVEAPARFSAEARAGRRNAIDAARQKALALPTATRDFGAVAAEYSYDQSTKFQGGDIGYLVEGKPVQGWEQPVIDAVWKADTDQVSDVITTEQGYYLVRITEKKPGLVRPLASVRALIESRLTEGKARALATEVAKKVTEHFSVKVFDDRLAAIKVPAEAKEPAQQAPPTNPGE